MTANHQRSFGNSPSQCRSYRGTVLIVCVLLSVVAGIYIFKSIRDLPGELIDKAEAGIEKAGRILKDIATAFNQGTISTSFTSYATTLGPTHNLQFATLRQKEVFTRTEEASTGFGYIPLPDIVIEARAPVEYTYFIDLNAKWEFVLQNETLYVHAPPIEFNEPAVNASEITYEVKKGSVFRNTALAKENLKKSVMPMVHHRAKDNISLVRETGRREVEHFVERWLAKSFSDGREYPVRILFDDEKLPTSPKTTANGME